MTKEEEEEDTYCTRKCITSCNILGSHKYGASVLQTYYNAKKITENTRLKQIP